MIIECCIISPSGKSELLYILSGVYRKIMKHPVRYFIHPLLVIWRNQGITNKKPKESDERTVSHAGEKKEKKKLCRPGLRGNKNSAWRVKMKKRNLRLEETVVVSFSFSFFFFFFFLFCRTTKTGKVEKVLGESWALFLCFCWPNYCDKIQSCCVYCRNWFL